MRHNIFTKGIDYGFLVWDWPGWQHLNLCLRRDVVIATLAINVLSLVLPIVILQLYDRIIPHQARGTLNVLVLGMLIAIIMDTTLRLCRALILSRLGAEFEKGAVMKVLETLLNSEFSLFAERRHSDYLEKIKAIEQFREVQFGQNILSLLDLPFIVCFIAMIAYFAGGLVLILLGLFAAFILFSAIIARSLYRICSERDTWAERRHNFLLELLQSTQTLKPLNMENQFMRRYERLQGELANTINHLAFHNHIIQAVTSVFSQLTMLAFVIAGASIAASGTLSVGALAAGTMLAGRVVQPTSRAINFWIQWQIAKVAQDKVTSLLKLPKEQSADNTPALQCIENITIKQVTFRHCENSPPVFENLSLEISHGEFIAITGKNSAGKTTLAKLLLGFSQPQMGDIFVNGKTFPQINRESFYQKVAFIPQRGVLFNGTILENLTGFRASEAVEQAIDYAKRLGLEKAITRMPDGLATVIDSTQVDNIPEAFRQRIVMVRALLGDPSLLIFDDANTGFNTEDNAKLKKLFAELKGKLSIVTMTHQPWLIALSDRSYRIDSGQLLEVAQPIKNAGEGKLVASGSPIYGGKFYG